MALTPGTKLGPYEIVAPIAEGGMGEVYRARDPRLSREVAIKVLPSSFCRDADRLRRFEQEARAAGALNHPNILAVYDVGAVDGIPYLVSELLQGVTVRDRLLDGLGVAAGSDEQAGASSDRGRGVPRAGDPHPPSSQDRFPPYRSSAASPSTGPDNRR